MSLYIFFIVHPFYERRAMSDNTTPCPFDDLCKSEVLAHILRNHPGVFTPGMAALLATAQQDPLVMCLPCSPSVQSVSAAAQHVSAAVHLGAVAVQLASAAPTCSRGDSCYQLTQSHISSCHRGILTDAMTRRAAGHRGPWSSNPSCHPSLGSTVKLASAAPTCKHGDDCYQLDLSHILSCHGGTQTGAMTQRAAGYQGPWSSNPSCHPLGSTVKLASAAVQLVSAAPTCSYGSSCYRTNPEHVRIFHGGKMPGTR